MLNENNRNCWKVIFSCCCWSWFLSFCAHPAPRAVRWPLRWKSHFPHAEHSVWGIKPLHGIRFQILWQRVTCVVLSQGGGLLPPRLKWTASIRVIDLLPHWQLIEFTTIENIVFAVWQSSPRWWFNFPITRPIYFSIFSWAAMLRLIDQLSVDVLLTVRKGPSTSSPSPPRGLRQLQQPLPVSARWPGW